MKLGFLAAVLVYAGLILGAGLLVRKKPGSLDSFFLGSRHLGPARIAFSLCAGWIGAASFLVSTDQAYREGLSAYWIIGLPSVVTLLLFLPLTRAVRNMGGSTIPDRMEARYGPAARPVTTVLIVWYMTALAASQMVAAGNFLKAFLGLPYLACLAAAAAVVLAYAAAGGFLAVVRTHAIQFFLLISGAVALVVSLTLRSPWAAVKPAAARLGRAGYFDFLAHGRRNGLIALSFVLAWTISPIAWQRIQAARSEASARFGLTAAAAVLALFYGGVVLAGMLFLPLFPGAAPAGPLVSEFIASRTGPLLGGLIFVAVLAAILSTMDAAVNAGAFTLAGDLVRYRRAGGPVARPVALGRAATLLVGALAFLLATRFQDILKALGLSSEIMAEGLFVPGLLAVLMKRRAPLAGLLSLAAGGTYALLGFLAGAGLLSWPLPAWPDSLPLGLALSAGGFVLGLVLEKLKARPEAGA